jgi:hypothetical protein
MYVSAKDIVQGTNYAQSTVCISLQYLCSNGLITNVGRQKIDGFDRNLYGATQGSHVSEKEAIDPHILSMCWPSITKVPSGYMRKIKGIIHDEAA